MEDNAIIIGAGTYGQVYAEYLKDTYNILGFIDDNKDLQHTVVNGYKVLGDLSFLLNTVDKKVKIFVPIGNTKAKVSILEKVRAAGFKTPNYIHPTANIHGSVKIGREGVYILQGTIIMPFSIIENDVMISSGTTITHHTTIQKGVFISFSVNVGASLTIKKHAYLGIGCTIMTGVKIVGPNSVIGAGAVIIRDVPDGATVVGNPGRILPPKRGV